MARRKHGGSNGSATWIAGVMPGQCRPTPPGNAQAQLPHLGNVTPFTCQDKTRFRTPPPEFTSPEYAKAIREMKLISGETSSVRT